MTQFLNVDFKTLVNADTVERVFVAARRRGSRFEARTGWRLMATSTRSGDRFCR